MNNNVIELNPPKHEAWQGILTPRQAEVAEMVAQGYTSSHIARTLFVEEQTVKYHLACVYERLDLAHNRQLSQRVVLARWWWTHIERNQFEMPLSAA
jgi:DNA-binding NarL/FixJ family response regulator